MQNLSHREIGRSLLVGGLLKCQFCSNTYKTDKMLRRDMNAKRNEMQSCNLCKRKFTKKDDLDDHRLAQHTTVAPTNNDERMITNGKDCTLYSYKCKTETNMKDHMIHQHNLKMCHKCEKTFIGI